MNESPRSTSVPAGPLGMQRPHGRGSLLRLAAMLGAIAAGSPADAARTAIVLQDTTYRSVSEFGPDTLLVRELVFEDPVVIAQIDESTGRLVAAVRRMDHS